MLEVVRFVCSNWIQQLDHRFLAVLLCPLADSKLLTNYFATIALKAHASLNASCILQSDLSRLQQQSGSRSKLRRILNTATSQISEHKCRGQRRSYIFCRSRQTCICESLGMDTNQVSRAIKLGHTGQS